MSTLLNVDKLSMHFPIHGGIFKRRVGSVFAVNNVSLQVKEGETLGIVGESGCGKTTLGRAIVQLYEPTSGHVQFDGADLAEAKDEELMSLRRNIQMIFQDPYASLNPRMNVMDILEEPMRIHKIGTKESRREKVLNLMDLVGLRRDDVYKFPHEFSGGQRQRIGIARALTLDPKLIIADEPVSALDVSIQSQVLNLMIELQKKLGLTYIFVSHDLTVVKYISDRVGVMYLGHLVELADTASLYKTPLHPYTQALLSSVPVPDPRKRGTHQILDGEVPSPSNPPPGCPFHTRCPMATSVCSQTMPQLTEMHSGHMVACHNVKNIQEEPLQ